MESQPKPSQQHVHPGLPAAPGRQISHCCCCRPPRATRVGGSLLPFGCADVKGMGAALVKETNRNPSFARALQQQASPLGGPSPSAGRDYPSVEASSLGTPSHWRANVAVPQLSLPPTSHALADPVPAWEKGSIGWACRREKSSRLLQALRGKNPPTRALTARGREPVREIGLPGSGNECCIAACSRSLAPSRRSKRRRHLRHLCRRLQMQTSRSTNGDPTLGGHCYVMGASLCAALGQQQLEGPQPRPSAFGVCNAGPRIMRATTGVALYGQRPALVIPNTEVPCKPPATPRGKGTPPEATRKPRGQQPSNVWPWLKTTRARLHAATVDISTRCCGILRPLRFAAATKHLHKQDKKVHRAMSGERHTGRLPFLPLH